MMLRVLIGCEESGVLTNAFRAAGFEAYSCDLKPTRGNPDHHFQMDIKACIKLHGIWDLIILHPDCTAMSLAGNSTYGIEMPKHESRIAQIEWTLDLWRMAKLHSPCVALENPASVIFPPLRELGANVQFIQPYQFGHLEQKKTGLALHGLPELTETNDVYEEMMKLPKRKRERIHYMAPGPNRKRDRSETFSGIASALVSQWGNIISRGPEL